MQIIATLNIGPPPGTIDTDAWFDAWLANHKAAYTARLDATRKELHAAFTARKTIIETMGRPTRWVVNTPSFVESCHNADFLTDHLMCRHEHWGTRLEIEEEDGMLRKIG